MKNDNENEKKEVINLTNKNDEEIYDAYAKLSKATLEFYKFIEQYDNKDLLIKKYQKIKSNKNI